MFHLRCTGLFEPFAYFGYISTIKNIFYLHLFGLELDELKSEAECDCLTKPKYETYSTLVESVEQESNDLSTAICYQSGLHFALFFKKISSISTSIFSVITNRTVNFRDENNKVFHFLNSIEAQNCFKFILQKNNQSNNLKMYVLYQFKIHFLHFFLFY